MKIIQIEVIQQYEDELGEKVAPKIICLTEEGEVYRLVDAGSPEERGWKLIK